MLNAKKAQEIADALGHADVYENKKGEYVVLNDSEVAIIDIHGNIFSAPIDESKWRQRQP